MNFLAHLFLADDTPESMLGNLAGDFVRGSLEDRFEPAIGAAILEHRKIDEFTDTHREISAFRRVIAADHRHYASVISDIFLDYFLSSDWHLYSDEPREEFIARVFRTLDPLIDRMPGHLPFVYERMRDGGWLQSYAAVRGIETALRNVSRRFTRPVRLDAAVHLLGDCRDELQTRSRAFFPEVIAFARGLRIRSIS